ncbi:uncharacterized protein LOC120354367 [Nilaparvata lugens]|uniref:uncharacterized protein LOC120354367 n=1 Tax=Nilaparvata lugens TaxID=108931 RepID=UPI00193E625B|nr:uncharacterized protein LOC120354367 [Nilaparvata lugens]
MQCCIRASIQIVFLTILMLEENSALTSVKTNKQKTPNGVLGIETSCTGENLTVTVDMEQSFHGAIHAKGFPIECRAVGQGDKFVQLTVAASSCGLRITPHKMS